MLQSITASSAERASGEALVRIGQASFPAPFSPGLEFNSPAHGTWNIVHTGMLVPEARQIYVCAYNCMRGVVLTAAEMNAADRFSYVILTERDLVLESLEDATIEGVSDVICKLGRRPPAVFLFTVCVHHFAGCDLRRIYRDLEARFPDIVFVRCYMDPIMQKLGLSPDQKLRKAMYDPLPQTDADFTAVSLIGSDFPLDETADLRRVMTQAGRRILELPACRTWEEYLGLAKGSLLIATYPAANYGAGELARRLGRPYLYLPSCFGYDEIRREIQTLAETLGIPDAALDPATEQNACDAALDAALAVIGDTPLVLDYTFHPRPLGLARLLLTHGFRVEAVCLDAVSREEEDDFYWLQAHVPALALISTNHVRSRVIPRNWEGRPRTASSECPDDRQKQPAAGYSDNRQCQPSDASAGLPDNQPKQPAAASAGLPDNQPKQPAAALAGCPDQTGCRILAIGQKAAWFTGSRHFVNLVQGGGLWGYDGIRRLADSMTDAFLHEKDTADLIVRKGLGCESCI